MDKEKEKDNQLTGGFKLFDFGGDSFTKAIKRTKSSENKLITTYVSMDEAVKDYHDTYDTHIKNLEKLDDYANFHGMENLFKKVIMKDNFKNGKVDKSIPILFRNYLIEEETTPSAFRKEHIMRQVNYVLEKHFAGREHMFIKHMHIADLGKHEFVLSITTIDNVKKNRTIPHNGYVISVSRTKKELKDILGTTKKNLKRKSKLVVFDNNSSNNSSSNASKTTKKSLSSSRYGKTKTKTKTRSRTKRSSNQSYIKRSSNNNARSASSASNFSKLASDIEIGTVKPKNSTKKEKLDMYLTPSQKQAKVAVQAIPSATQFGAPLPQPTLTTAPQFAPALGAPVGLEQRKAEILGVPGMNFQAPVGAQVLAPGTPVQINNNSAVKQKCMSYQTLETCNADKQCFFSRNAGKCFKSNRPPGEAPRPAFGPFQPFGAHPTPLGQPPAPAPAFGAPAPMAQPQAPALSPALPPTPTITL